METKKAATGRDADRWWVVQQHEDFTVVRSDEPPDVTPVAGERIKRLQGPFKSKDAAEAAAKKGYARTQTGQHEERVK